MAARTIHWQQRGQASSTAPCKRSHDGVILNARDGAHDLDPPHAPANPHEDDVVMADQENDAMSVLHPAAETDDTLMSGVEDNDFAAVLRDNSRKLNQSEDTCRRDASSSTRAPLRALAPSASSNVSASSPLCDATTSTSSAANDGGGSKASAPDTVIEEDPLAAALYGEMRRKKGEKELSFEDLGEALEKEEGYVRGIFDGKIKPTAGDMDRLDKALDVPAEVMGYFFWGNVDGNVLPPS